MEKNKRSESAKAAEHPARQDKIKRSSLYNYREMNRETVSTIEGFAARLCQLRTERNLSAREMSLSLGQGVGYINNIENGHNMPSMTMFFEICEFLQVSPCEFFWYTKTDRLLCEKLLSSARRLSTEDLELLIRLVNKLQKE